MWDIVFEHKDFVVINKPCGVSVHSESEGDVCLTASLAQQLGVERVWLAHRLDKATSGLLLFALNRDSAAALSAQFAEKTMRKTYWHSVRTSRRKSRLGERWYGAFAARYMEADA